VELDSLRAQCRSIFEAEKQVTQAIFRIAWRRDRRLLKQRSIELRLAELERLISR
jgi:hypothetical protein